MDILLMKSEEIKRLGLINKILSGELTQVKAAKVIELSVRQIGRIVKRVKESGSRGIIHQLRGRKSPKKIDGKNKEGILGVYEKKYKGFGPTLAVEKLRKEGIRVNRETLRQWLLEEGFITRQRKGRKHRLWRARKEYYGEMVQMDGSHHAWLEERGPGLVLMGYIDDATNRVYGRFYEYEGTMPALKSFKRYIKKHGIPTSVYLDRHSTYKVTHYDEWKAKVFGDEEPLSQFERALKELGVSVIHANSAPAKGRVERLFRTLQDRLVKELRLANAKTLEEANNVLEKYLIEHNGRFMVEPVKAANLHRQSPSEKELNDILCVKKEHPLRNDFTIAHEKKLYQITQYTTAKKIEVRNRVDGTMVMLARGRVVKYKEIQKLPVKRRVRLSQKSRMRRLDKNRSWGTVKPRNVFSFS